MKIRKSISGLAVMALLLTAGWWWSAQSAQRSADGYALAGVMPRGALLYAQVEDWPQALRTWQGSELKTRYEQSVNYQQLWERHLLNKLASRWEEFNTAAGFEIGADALLTLADKRAALAIYDIGKLEMVWVAPMGQSQQAACAFLKQQANFEERESAEGLPYYVHTVEADRGRQKQELCFALVKDYFVLATSERWLVRTLVCIKKTGRQDALSAEPKFNALSRSLAPADAAIWVDQERLNQDWYFRHYWVPSSVKGNVAELKHLRAGLFTLDWQNERWTERREFLTDGKLEALAPLPRETWQRVAVTLPADLPYVQARACASADETLVREVRDALFSRLDAPPAVTAQAKGGWRWRRYYDDRTYETEGESIGEEGDDSNYQWLDSRFNATIDDAEEAGDTSDDAQLATLRTARERQFATTMRGVLAAAQPTMRVRVQRPQVLTAPLLAEFQHGIIVSLANPAALDRAALETALNELAASRLLIAGAKPVLTWRTNGVARELALPWLGRTLVYAVRGSELWIGDSATLLQDWLKTNAAQRGTVLPQAATSEITLIRLSTRAQAFDPIFARLEAPKVEAYWKERRGKEFTGQEPSQEFFSGNVASLLDVAAPVRELVVQRHATKDRLREEVAMVMASEK